jgi:hypothetical protein
MMMNLSFPQCKAVLDTLPIGYYTSRRIPIEISKTEETSSYNIMEDKITVSYPIIEERAKALPENADTEQAIRSMLYHEVSHAILTPTNLVNNHNAVNIFEDERIETILSNYYHNVDFKQQVRDISADGGAPTSPDQVFYRAVRLREAPEDINKEIDSLINRYRSLNRNGDYYRSMRYRSDIMELYNKITGDYKANPDRYSMPNQGEGNGEKDKSQQDSKNGSPQNQKGKKDGENQQLMPQKGNCQQTEMSEEMREQIKESFDSALSPIPNDMEDGQRQQLEEFKRKAETIISNFNKKNSGGNGINSYSGVFNPRAVARQDYRYFERSMSVQGNNKFGTCNLNLIIDCSGSFWNSEKIMNGILYTLSEIERKNRNFSMNVVFINTAVRKCEKVKDRVFSAHGGNTIPKEMKNIMNELQKQNTCNYNIVCFDGDAFTDDYRGDINSQIKRFKAFDRNQTTLITNEENVRYLGGGFNSARVVVTNEYTDKLIEHITKALTIAFG